MNKNTGWRGRERGRGSRRGRKRGGERDRESRVEPSLEYISASDFFKLTVSLIVFSSEDYFPFNIYFRCSVTLTDDEERRRIG